ncbi:MAG: M20/M25/M40 family metallo-hydrolase [Candidatus Caldarchaeum sp.]|nr:M20/M25/M40 family metallo-hydrolase [Candidatus Caldarchaeum sp.]
MSNVDILKRIETAIQSDFDKALEDLRRLISVPSVSARNQFIGECADLVKGLLERDGFDVKILDGDGGAPFVYAVKDGGKPSILLYNHYDVQPPEPLEQWRTDPFQLTELDGVFHGRGVADNKGEIAVRLSAVRVVEKVMGKLPLTIKWLIEGEEEVGSPRIATVVSKNRSLFQDVIGCMWEGGDVDDRGPIFYLGVKGILYVELSLKTANADIHSMYAPVVENAAEKMTRIVMNLKDERGRIRIKGFYDDVRRPSEAEKKLAKSFGRRSEDLARSLGVDKLKASKDNFLAKLMFDPTCNVAGFYSGYTGPGSKTIVPSSANVKIDFRLVPNQDPEKILLRLKKFLPRDIEVKVHGMSHPARINPDNPLVKIAVEAAETVYGRKPVVLPNTPGTGPLSYFVKAGIPTAMVSALAHPGSGLHAPNENIYREHFIKSIEHHAMVFIKAAERA